MKAGAVSLNGQAIKTVRKTGLAKPMSSDSAFLKNILSSMQPPLNFYLIYQDRHTFQIYYPAATSFVKKSEQTFVFLAIQPNFLLFSEQ
jgi:hypothetical protein